MAVPTVGRRLSLAYGASSSSSASSMRIAWHTGQRAGSALSSLRTSSLSPSSTGPSFGRRGVATQAHTAVSSTTTTTTTTTSALDGLSAYGDATTSFFAPLVPYIDQLPTWFGMAQHTPLAYAVSIVVATTILRTTITLPVTLWQRARTRRMIEQVGPAWQEVKRNLPADVARRCRAQRKSHEEYRATLQKELQQRLRALAKQHKCTPIPTIAVPLAVNVPVFIAVSLALRTALMSNGAMIGAEVVPWWSPPSDLMAKFEEGAKVLQARGLEGESLSKLTTMLGPTLSETDKTMFTPIGLGMLTLINVELGQWLRRPLLEGGAGLGRTNDDEDSHVDVKTLTERQRNALEAREKRKSIAELRSTVIGNTLRAASIAFVVVASQAPTGLTLYWLSSAAYTLVQNAIFAQIDRRRAAKIRTIQGR